eukprot:gene26065-biopygen13430
MSRGRCPGLESSWNRSLRDRSFHSSLIPVPNTLLCDMSASETGYCYGSMK